jgi:hypothetical protein
MKKSIFRVFNLRVLNIIKNTLVLFVIGGIILVISLYSCKVQSGDFIGTWKLIENQECYLKLHEDGTGELWITKDSTQKLDYTPDNTGNLIDVQNNFELSTLFNTGYSELKWTINDSKLEIVFTNSLKIRELKKNPALVILLDGEGDIVEETYKPDTLDYLYKFNSGNLTLYEEYGSKYFEHKFQRIDNSSDSKNEKLIVDEFRNKAYSIAYNRNHTFTWSINNQLADESDIISITGNWAVFNGHLFMNLLDIKTSREKYMTLINGSKWEKFRFLKFKIISIDQNMLIYKGDFDNETIIDSLERI